MDAEEPAPETILIGGGRGFVVGGLRFAYPPYAITVTPCSGVIASEAKQSRKIISREGAKIVAWTSEAPSGEMERAAGCRSYGQDAATGV